jgi:hypothetical protein
MDLIRSTDDPANRPDGRMEHHGVAGAHAEPPEVISQ